MILLEEFKNMISEENLVEMKKLDMPIKWAYKEYIDIMREEKLEEYDVNTGVKRIVNEYIDELLYRENKKYDLDWE